MALGTFCIYCQVEYHTDDKLIDHVFKYHPNTYASNAAKAIIAARDYD